MGARPGTIAVIEPDRVQAGLVSTHALPLTVVMEYTVRETRAGATLIGIQPDLSGPGREISGPDMAYLEQNIQELIRILAVR